jgi:ABC-type branched-subunit amino acid transport system ATPase component
MNFVYLGLLNNANVSVGQANLLGFAAAVMTTSKTILYWLVEAFSGMAHTGHNSVKDMIFLWVVSSNRVTLFLIYIY